MQFGWDKKVHQSVIFCPFWANLANLGHYSRKKNFTKKIAKYRDQIWFAEKDKPHEATVLKRLSEIEMSDEGEFRKVRRDRIFEKDYFDKKYGALPEVSDGFDLIEAMKG